MGLLSKLAEQVTFVLIPPLVLIFLVLGTIFLGVATPTEGGAMGAVGALVMAVSRKRLNMALLKQALVSTTRLSSFVMFILIGSTVFSFTFNAADGHVWVEHLFDSLPGGAMGFLIVVNVLVFILGMFIDFFEIAFIVIPMLAPVAAKILPELMPGVPVDALMIWFGVIIAMNLQTSFLTPPFGFALFYLRSVAARSDYKDRVTGETIPAVTTAQIYKGSIPFIVLQLIMVGVVIAFPSLVIDGLDSNAPKIDAEKALEQLQTGRDALQKLENEIPQGGERAPAHDPMKDLLEAIKQGEQKK
jgi:tripartite ATP-independent transporter DctM subunit